ncbi:MAG: ATP-binding cassette domain-containing protein [Clostridiaceae bacterium]
MVGAVSKITIVGGHDKTGNAEDIKVDLIPGEIVCVVGPTGSGKSRLLADIEYMAQKDTPTGRIILINDESPDISNRFSFEDKLVAQLSQNMNFIMDCTVREFINIHAECRGGVNVDETIEVIIEKANELAGEKFTGSTPLTALSGGQSRALMIADTAFLSTSPIVLIDEIENAGIERKKALELLVKKDKIVLMATHDPMLILMGDKRLVIKNGRIDNVILTSEKEKLQLQELELLDSYLLSIRNSLRNGETIEESREEYFEGYFEEPFGEGYHQNFAGD